MFGFLLKPETTIPGTSKLPYYTNPKANLNSKPISSHIPNL